MYPIFYLLKGDYRLTHYKPRGWHFLDPKSSKKCMGMVDRKMESTIESWGYMGGVMDKRMDTTILLGVKHGHYSIYSFFGS